MKFEVTTVVCHDGDANVDKFYRTFAGEDGTEVRQNGRIGVNGAFQYFKRPSGAAARMEADKQIRSKENGHSSRYWGRTVTDLDYPDARVPKNKDEAKHLGIAFHASNAPGSRPAELVGGQGVAPVATSAPTAVTSELDAMLDEVLEGINAAIADPAKGMQIYIELRDKITGAEDRVVQARSYYETLETLVLQ